MRTSLGQAQKEEVEVGEKKFQCERLLGSLLVEILEILKNPVMVWRQ
jgi:hypothetical protein